jgi:YfiH family protein
MRVLEVGGRRYAQFETLQREPGLAHAFSTRPWDVSLRNGPRLAECAGRRRQVAIDFGRDPHLLCCCDQVHDSRVALVTDVAEPQVLRGCDAAVTDQPRVSLMAFSADCPLVLAYDRVQRVVGVAHASWRCTVAMITRRLVEVMRQRFGCRPASLVAGVGPSAGPDRYEVQEDVLQAAAELPARERLFHRRAGRLYFDLWEANHTQLQLAGVLSENIEIARICTMERTDLFYSYRREGAGCGHFCLLAGLRKTN